MSVYLSSHLVHSSVLACVHVPDVLVGLTCRFFLVWSQYMSATMATSTAASDLGQKLAPFSRGLNHINEITVWHNYFPFLGDSFGRVLPAHSVDTCLSGIHMALSHRTFPAAFSSSLTLSRALISRVKRKEQRARWEGNPSWKWQEETKLVKSSDSNTQPCCKTASLCDNICLWALRFHPA